MSVPSNILENFKRACVSLPVLNNLYLNIDHTMTAAEFHKSKPFKSLHIRYVYWLSVENCFFISESV